MAVYEQSKEAIRWIEAGWVNVAFPVPADTDEIRFGGGPIFLINSARDLVFIDLDGSAYEIEPFLKEFVKVGLRDAEPTKKPVILPSDDAQIPFKF